MNSNCFRLAAINCTLIQGSLIPASPAPASQAVPGVAISPECTQRQWIRPRVIRARAALCATSGVIQAARGTASLARIAGTAQNLVAVREPVPGEPAIQALSVSQYEPVCFPVAVHVVDGKVDRCPAAGAGAAVMAENSVPDNLGMAVLLPVNARPAPGAKAIRRYTAPVKTAGRECARPFVVRARTPFQISRLSHGRRFLLRQGPEAHGAGNTVSGPRGFSLVGLMSRYGGRL